MAYKVYFYLIPFDTYQSGQYGKNYVMDHKDEWVDGSIFKDYLAAGWTKGVDAFVYNDKAWMLTKSFMILEENAVVHACYESVIFQDKPKPQAIPVTPTEPSTEPPVTDGEETD
jgi:hypothetical protein